MSGFQKFKEKFPGKEKTYSSLMGKKYVVKSMSIYLRFGIILKCKRGKIITTSA